MSMCAGGSLARQTAKLANGNIPYHKRRAQFMNGFGQGEKAIGSSQFPWVFESALGWEFELFFGLQIGPWVVRKIVLYIVCSAYLLL